MKKYILVFSLIATFCLISTVIFAAPPPPPPAQVPIDGGLSIVIGAGIAFGAKKLYEKRNPTK